MQIGRCEMDSNRRQQNVNRKKRVKIVLPQYFFILFLIKRKIFYITLNLIMTVVDPYFFARQELR